MSTDTPRHTLVDGRPVIGAAEWIGLPALGVPAIRARVDTGAHTSALHVEDAAVEERDGAPWIRFRVPNRMRKADRWWSCEAPVDHWRRVRNTSGEAEQRPVIVTEITLGAWRYRIDVTLTGRERMRYHFLLGRSAMQGGLLVDPGHAFLHGKPQR